jgi:hypothetical protein
MIQDFTNHNGQRTFTFTAADLAAATEWARSMCHATLGPKLGELQFRRIPALQILSLWSNRTAGLEEA